LTYSQVLRLFAPLFFRPAPSSFFRYGWEPTVIHPPTFSALADFAVVGGGVLGGDSRRGLPVGPCSFVTRFLYFAPFGDGSEALSPREMFFATALSPDFPACGTFVFSSTTPRPAFFFLFLRVFFSAGRFIARFRGPHNMESVSRAVTCAPLVPSFPDVLSLV